MIQVKTENLFADVFIIVVCATLVLTGYFLISMMNVLPQGDNSTRAVLLLSLLIIISTVVQLAILAVVGKIRERLERKR